MQLRINAAASAGLMSAVVGIASFAFILLVGHYDLGAVTTLWLVAGLSAAGTLILLICRDAHFD